MPKLAIDGGEKTRKTPLPARRLFGEEEKAAAMKLFDKAIELDPTYAEAWNNKGVSLFHLGKYEEALEAFDKAIGINPEYIQAQNNKITALEKLNGEESKNI